MDDDGSTGRAVNGTKVALESLGAIFCSGCGSCCEYGCECRPMRELVRFSRLSGPAESSVLSQARKYGVSACGRFRRTA